MEKWRRSLRCVKTMAQAARVFGRPTKGWRTIDPLALRYPPDRVQPVLRRTGETGRSALIRMFRSGSAETTSGIMNSGYAVSFSPRAASVPTYEASGTTRPSGETFCGGREYRLANALSWVRRAQSRPPDWVTFIRRAARISCAERRVCPSAPYRAARLPHRVGKYFPCFPQFTNSGDNPVHNLNLSPNRHLDSAGYVEVANF
jgi:hypothetical protein